jgi:hypothetical protein
MKGLEVAILTTQHPPTMCPTCGARLDAATSTDGANVPKEGDVSVCLYCYAWLSFRADQSLRPISHGEVRKRFGRAGIARFELIERVARRVQERTR